ncbi:hypothetical protein ACFQ2B_11395 [Streptomyces stramineus]
MSGGIEGKDSLKTGKGALDGIAKGLNGAIEELKKIGSPATPPPGAASPSWPSRGWRPGTRG